MNVHLASLCLFVLTICAFWLGRYVRVNRAIALPPSHVRFTKFLAPPRSVIEFDSSEEMYVPQPCVGPCCSEDSYTTWGK